jgi:hypothetical protein
MSELTKAASFNTIKAELLNESIFQQISHVVETGKSFRHLPAGRDSEEREFIRTEYTRQLSNKFAIRSRENLTLAEITLPFNALSDNSSETKRLRYLEEIPREARQSEQLFNWIEENYSLAVYFEHQSHWKQLQEKLTFRSYWIDDSLVSPLNLVDLHWILFHRSMCQTRMDAAFDLMRQMSLDLIDHKLRHTPFRRAGKKRMSFAE